MSSHPSLPGARVSLPESEVERRTALAFESTNATEYTGLCKNWFAKGLREGADISATVAQGAPLSRSEEAEDDPGMTREEWVGEAKQVYLKAGDDEVFATEQAAWLWTQQDWSSGELDSPVDAVQEDLRGRPRPASTDWLRAALLEISAVGDVATKPKTPIEAAFKAVHIARKAIAELAARATTASAEPIELRGIVETLKEGQGCWRTCSGCHESNEGHPTGPFSATLNCTLGQGCGECGGIGAVWDTTDYGAMAEAMVGGAQTA
jgi:hypothetical protein